ncbi:MAG: hypothetical protein K1000chlam3_01733 [Chlamydiae bacterium]|nr:hypothetical protein [Chlamydiota bacterium]
MSAAISQKQSTSEIVQALQTMSIQQATKLEELATKINAMNIHLAKLDEKVAKLEGKASIVGDSIEISQAQALYNEGQSLIEKKQYANAAECLKKGIEEECDDSDLRGKLFLALFKVLISLNKGEEILTYKDRLLTVFNKAEGPSPERVKAAIIMGKQVGSYVRSDFFRQFSGIEKFKEVKGPLVYHIARSLVNPSREECKPRWEEALKYNLSPEKKLICYRNIVFCLYYEEDSLEKIGYLNEILSFISITTFSKWPSHLPPKEDLTKLIEEVKEKTKQAVEGKASKSKSSWW